MASLIWREKAWKVLVVEGCEGRLEGRLGVEWEGRPGVLGYSVYRS